MKKIAIAFFAFGLVGWAVWFGQANRAPDDTKWRQIHTIGDCVIWQSDSEPKSYLVCGAKESILIDAVVGPETLPKGVVVPNQVWLTHSHRDTVAAAERWQKAGATLHASPNAKEWLDREAVETFWKNAIPLRNSRTGYFVVPVGLDNILYDLTDETRIKIGTATLVSLATPGHSYDHTAFVLATAAERIVFTGDLFAPDGKLWTPFTTDWDHWTDAGLKPAAGSVRKVSKLKPILLLPARGESIRAMIPKFLDDCASRIDAVGKLKSFERFTNQLGNVPKYEFLVEPQQVASGGDKPWSKVGPRLWITGNTYVLASRDGPCFVLDPWGQRSIDQIAKLRADEKLGAIEVVSFSHAHYDHFDGVYLLPNRQTYKVWGLESVALPLEEPFRLRAPFMDARPIRFDKRLKDNETVTWREYSFRYFALPGQSEFTCGIETTIAGKKCCFTADNFFHQKQFSGSGGWMGLNRSFPNVYAQSAKKLLDIKPDWILAEHGGPYEFDAEDYRRRVDWGTAAHAAASGVCVASEPQLDWNPNAVSVIPYCQRAEAGVEVKIRIEIASGLKVKQLLIRGRGLFPDETINFVGQQDKVSVPIRFTRPIPSGRHVFAVESTTEVPGERWDTHFAIDVDE